MTKPTAYPIWGTDVAAVIAEPTLSKKQAGWLAPEKPADGAFNWWMNLVYQWILYQDTEAPAAAGAPTLTFDTFGRLSSVTSSDGTTTLTYGAFGQPATIANGAKTITHTRNSLGRLTSGTEA